MQPTGQPSGAENDVGGAARHGCWTRETGLAEARRRIALCRATREDELDLGGLMLSVVPDEVLQLTWLKRLYLGGDAEVREKPHLAFINGEKNEKRCNALGALPGAFSDALTALVVLDLSWNGIGDDGARALGQLTGLTTLDLSGNGSIDPAPLLSLGQLRKLTLSRRDVTGPGPELWRLPFLSRVVFEPGRLAGVPSELLSKGLTDDCLPRLRAFFDGFAAGGVALSDVKVMLLGNGRVGKTKIARRFAGEDYGADDEPSTHGVQVKETTLAMPAGPDAKLRIWDFGGQDMYHGTHALFMKTRAVFAVVWTPAAEDVRHHVDGFGFTHRNQPLGYWLAYVRQMGGARSPVLVIQSQADTLDAKVAPPVADDVLAGFEPRAAVVAYSAKTNLRRGTLDDALVDAVASLRYRDGEIFIPRSWDWVKQGLEELFRLDQLKPAGERQHRLFSLAAFHLLCDAARERVGPVDDWVLLGYLHDTGTVFWREGLFGNRMILDQQWALDAVYAVFDRERCWSTLQRYRGRFKRSDLAELAWGAFEPEEQELFLSFMVECGIAFVAQDGDEARKIETEYIAPDLLPTRGDRHVDAELRRSWDEPADREVVLSYDLLPPGLIRALLSRIGQQAGDDAFYWRDGVMIYDEVTRSRGLIEQHVPEDGWSGTLRIATERGNALALFDKLIELVRHENEAFGAKPRNMPGRAEHDLRGGHGAREPNLTVRRERPADRLMYVSYAWADKTDPARAEVVDKLCAAAKSKGIAIQRDIETLKVGDSIRAYMKNIGEGDRIFIALSDKYWRSAYCMFELYEIWRNCKLDVEKLRARTRVYALPCAKLSSPDGLEEIIAFWKDEEKRIAAALALEQEDRIRRLSDQEVIDHRMMRDFISQLAKLRTAFLGLVRAANPDDYIAWALEGLPPGEVN